jgi:hypothetical protein
MTRALALFSFVSTFAALGSSAHAVGFNLKIDCHGSNGLPDWSHSPNTIKVEALIHGFWNTVATFVPTPELCGQEDMIRLAFPAFSGFEVQTIRFSTNGTNVFWMDEFVLADVSASPTFWKWGIDNNVGFCFSKQSTDGANSYCQGGAARAVWDFNK